MSENEQAVEKFDPSKLMDGVRDRIKATFVSIIPDNHWEKLVQGVINDFMTKKKKGYGYNDELTSDFDNIVKDELKMFLKEKISESLNKYMEKEYDKNGNQLINKHIKKLLIDNSEVLVAQMFGHVAENIIQEVQNKMRYR